MSYNKCDLCGVDDAVEDGLLCFSCREAIARLVVISAAVQSLQDNIADATAETVNRPENKQNTRKVGS